MPRRDRTPVGKKPSRTQPSRQAKAAGVVKATPSAPTRTGLRKSTTQQRVTGAVPPKKVGGKDIFSGSRNFTSAFQKRFWNDPNNQACVKCGRALRKGRRGIDHIRPWSVVQTTLRQQTVCKNGVHWKVVLKRDFDALYHDERNLQATCKSCNSSKGGVKGNDPMHPQIVRNQVCPERQGGHCRVTKAT